MNARNKSETKANRMDFETADFYARVRDAYLGIARREPERFRIVDASRSVEETQREVLDLITKSLKID